jgi:hypothetical protein
MEKVLSVHLIETTTFNDDDSRKISYKILIDEDVIIEGYSEFVTRYLYNFLVGMRKNEKNITYLN